MIKKYGAPDPTAIHSFKKHWPNIKPTVRNLIFKEPISLSEWQDLFHEVHMICSWDAKGPYKLLKNLEYELRDSYISKIHNRLKSIDDGQQQLKEYIDCWSDFKQHCDRFPIGFQQLDLATRGIITQLRSNKVNPSKASRLAQLNARAQAYPINMRKQNDSTVRFLMLKLWNDHVVKHLEKRLQASAKELVSIERSGFIIDSNLIIGLRESFYYLDELSIIDHENDYIRTFETTYVESIEIFYASRADEFLREKGVIEFIKWALIKLYKEEQKANQYLGSNLEAIEMAAEACTRVLIENFTGQILHASFRFMCTNDFENIKMIFKFLDKIEGMGDKLLDQLQYHIVSSGLDDLKISRNLVSNNPDKFVEKLLDIHNRFSRIISTSFDNDIRAKQALDKAFGLIVNDTNIFNAQENDFIENNTFNRYSTKNAGQPELRCADLLANYCNMLFRKSTYSRKLTLDELSERLNEVLLIVRLLKSKDSFLKLHKLHLMRRLILDASVNYEKEEEFVLNLRQVTGTTIEQINELLRMFKDLKSSEALRCKFMKTMGPILDGVSNNNNNNNTISSLTSQVTSCLNLQDDRQIGKHDLINIKILNPSAWSKVCETYPIKLPDDISGLLPDFETFYRTEYEGRELEWCHHLSNGIITFNNDRGGKFDLEVTAAQLAILSSYNYQPRAGKTLGDLSTSSELSSSELKKTLWTLLSNPKLKIQIMKCEPIPESIRNLENESNVYSINHDFVLM